MVPLMRISRTSLGSSAITEPSRGIEPRWRSSLEQAIRLDGLDYGQQPGGRRSRVNAEQVKRCIPAEHGGDRRPGHHPHRPRFRRPARWRTSGRPWTPSCWYAEPFARPAHSVWTSSKIEHAAKVAQPPQAAKITSRRDVDLLSAWMGSTRSRPSGRRYRGNAARSSADIDEAEDHRLKPDRR